jgi:hypothetical protein
MIDSMEIALLRLLYREWGILQRQTYPSSEFELPRLKISLTHNFLFYIFDSPQGEFLVSQEKLTRESD